MTRARGNVIMTGMRGTHKITINMFPIEPVITIIVTKRIVKTGARERERERETRIQSTRAKTKSKHTTCPEHMGCFSIFGQTSCYMLWCVRTGQGKARREERTRRGSFAVRRTSQRPGPRRRGLRSPPGDGPSQRGRPLYLPGRCACCPRGSLRTGCLNL